MPTIEQVPWAYGGGAYYRGQNNPAAVVLHRQQGYATTARQWAQDGHSTASWHYTVSFDGSIMQHLQHRDGGYHAGIPSTAPPPTWSLWRGHGVNVNKYTIGVECEGFVGGDWPEAQLESLRWLCRKLADELGIPYDREHFPAHAEIDVLNRVNDFDTPERREGIVYPYLFQEDAMTDDDLLAIFSGKEESHLSRGERLTNARYRRDEAAAGRAPSIRDLAASASTLVTTHIAQPHGGRSPVDVEATLLKHLEGHGGFGVTADDISNAFALGGKAAADSIRFAAQRGSGG